MESGEMGLGRKGSLFEVESAGGPCSQVVMPSVVGIGVRNRLASAHALDEAIRIH